MGDVVAALEGVLGERRGRRGIWVAGAVATMLAGAVGWWQPWRAGEARPPEAPTAAELQQARAHALQVLTADLRSSTDAVQRAAVQAAGWSRTTRLREPLEALLESDHATLVTQVADALGKLGDPQAVPRLRALLKRPATTPDWSRARLAVARALLSLGDAEGREVLHAAVHVDPSTSAVPDQPRRDAERLSAALLLCDTDDADAQALLSQLAAEPSTPRSTVLEILGCQGQRSQGAQARAALQQQLRVSQGKDQLAVAARLGSLGDEEARDILRKKLTATRSGTGPAEEALLAARALAGADEPAVLPLLRRTVQRGGSDIAARTLASEALALCGELSDLRLLKQQLDLFDSPPVRQITAAALLLLSAQDHDGLADSSLSWARAALGDADLAARLSAVAALGYSPQSESLRLLAQVLRDPSPALRRGALHALAARRSDAALRLMHSALRDPDIEVRHTAVRAIVGVLRSLGPDGVGGLVAEALQWFAQSLHDSPEWLRRAARLALSDPTAADEQRREPSLTESADPAIQTWLVELGLASPAQLQRLASSADAPLRLAAARALLGDPTPAARDAVAQAAAALHAQGGPWGLDAAGLQLALGDAAQARAELAKAALSADVDVRRHVLDVLARLPPKARERGQAVLRRLLQDRVLGLRAYAAALLSEAHGPPIARSEAAPSDATAATNGGLPQQPDRDGGTAPAAEPAPASQQVSAATEQHPIEPAAEAQQQHEERLAQARALLAQAMRDSTDSDPARATKLLLRARALCASPTLRSHGDCIEISATATAKLAAIYEKSARFTEAMSEYQQLLSSPASSPAVVEHRREAQRAAVRMGLRLGRVIVHTQSAGRCREVVYWLAPGRGTVRVGSTQEEVSVQAGDVLHRGKCP